MSAAMTAALCALILLASSSISFAAETRRVSIEHGTAALHAAIAPEGAAIVHTEQVYVLAKVGGQTVRQNDPAGEAARVLKQLLVRLQDAGAKPDPLLRVNLYAATPEAAATARQIFEQELQPTPPITCVVTALPDPNATIAADAVAWVARDDNAVTIREGASILPSGGATFISGQAAKGDMATATRETMAGLGKTLEFLKLTRDDVAQVKAFLQTMSEAAIARREIEAFFAPKDAPPISFVEWTMNAPIEIEMIAKEAPQQDPSSGTVEFITPPWFKPSPVYCKVTVVHGGSMIFTSGLVSAKPMPDAAANEVRDIFDALRELITKAGGDMTHLAKATYYPATDETSKALNQIRPEFYDPQRPPAASKAPVRGTGVAGRHITLDIIGVTPR